VLVLGGYGGFGARISRRIARAGYRVVVAGRSQAKANRFCEGEPAMISAAFDRADIEHALATIRPNVVVDASGPFQAMDYSVPKACIAARIHYCDIADGRDFVCGIASLDAEAKAANVAVVSGASSVPALSGAVVRELASGMDRIQAVEQEPSGRTPAMAGRLIQINAFAPSARAVLLAGISPGGKQEVFSMVQIGVEDGGASQELGQAAA
jgi:saccharopine dehydrogenase-like NADP-dependent oxidoreductase